MSNIEIEETILKKKNEVFKKTKEEKELIKKMKLEYKKTNQCPSQGQVLYK